jgi:hypothetical protein
MVGRTSELRYIPRGFPLNIILLSNQAVKVRDFPTTPSQKLQYCCSILDLRCLPTGAGVVYF